MNALKILCCLLVILTGAWAFNLGGNALTVMGFSFTLIGSMMLVDTLFGFKEF